MSDSIQKLREAIRREAVMATKHGRCICATCDEATEDAHAALAAVEQEMAALEKDRDHCQRLYLEACELGSGHARIAALEAERDELRKRPTLEEVLAEMDKVPDKPAGLNFGVAACAMKVTGLYARKAGA